jgi:hypothetical protein
MAAMTDTPTPQPDLSDEAIRHLARMLVACECEETDCKHCNRIYDSIISVRDQARAAERKRTLLWAAEQAATHEEHGEFLHGGRDECPYAIAQELRRAAEEGGK